MVNAESVARLIRLNGGELIGKTRLQKSAYFLETKRVGFGFDFSYHHYGPYSEELANCTDDAAALQFIEVDWRHAQGGMNYAVFQCKQSSADEDGNDTCRRRILDALKKYSSVEVELAATADFLKQNGYEKDPWTEMCRRKASKVNDLRLRKSKQLLSEIDDI